MKHLFIDGLMYTNSIKTKTIGARLDDAVGVHLVKSVLWFAVQKRTHSFQLVL